MHAKDDDDDDKGSKMNHHRHKRHENHSSKSHSNSEKTSSKGEERRKGSHHDRESNDGDTKRRRSADKDYSYKERHSDVRWRKEVNRDDAGRKGSPPIYNKDRNREFDSSDTAPRNGSSLNKRRNPVKLTEEERAAKLREMQMDAELHEEQRWKRIKKADENDAQEAAVHSQSSRSRNFLDGVQKSIYGTEKTIEESVRRRAHYSQGRSESTDRNAFRR